MTELEPRDAPLLEPGQQIAHYRVERYIDRGGMGEVYLALNTKLGADVAIKLLPERFSGDSRRFAAPPFQWTRG